MRYTGAMNNLLIWGSAFIGVLFIALAAYYWITPAGNLPHFVPGYEAGVSTVHFKHGLASLLLGAGLFVFSWFQSGKRSPQQTEAH